MDHFLIQFLQYSIVFNHFYFEKSLMLGEKSLSCKII